MTRVRETAACSRGAATQTPAARLRRVRPALASAGLAFMGGALLAAAPASAAPAPKTNPWTSPVVVGDAPSGTEAGVVARLGITTNGRGTVAWNSGGSAPTIATRDFTVGGTLGPQVGLGAGSLVSAVTRDESGNAAVAALSAGAAPFAWIAGRKAAAGSAWQRKTLASGPAVNAPAAVGLKSGFLVATTSSFIPTTAEEGLPTAAAFGVTPDGASVALGKELTGVETGDFSHGADGSNWAATASGHLISTGRRETSKASKGKSPKSVAALVRVGKTPTRNSILGVDRFGGGSVTTVGERVAVAGLDVQQTNEIAVRGVPVIAQGEEDALGEATPIGGVPDRRALEVDVAGRAGGGAVVTWLQQTSSRAENLLGQPKWAVVDEDGEVVARGAFSTAKDARSLRVVRAGALELAMWIRGTGAKARWYAARISGETVRLVKAPTGAPVGRVEGGLNTGQLQANGRQVALTFVDRATNTVRVATQTLR